jgi:hypothetical protein
MDLWYVLHAWQRSPILSLPFRHYTWPSRGSPLTRNAPSLNYPVPLGTNSCRLVRVFVDSDAKSTISTSHCIRRRRRSSLQSSPISVAHFIATPLSISPSPYFYSPSSNCIANGRRHPLIARRPRTLRSSALCILVERHSWPRHRFFLSRGAITVFHSIVPHPILCLRNCRCFHHAVGLLRFTGILKRGTQNQTLSVVSFVRSSPRSAPAFRSVFTNHDALPLSHCRGYKHTTIIGANSPLATYVSLNPTFKTILHIGTARHLLI